METTDKVIDASFLSSELVVADVSKTFATKSGPIEALHHIDLTVAHARFICIVGPSGCGKSTLLRMMAGLTPCEQGEIRFRNELRQGPCRQIGMVFQEYSLFPWLNVLDNTGIGLQFNGMCKSQREQEARRYLGMVGLEKFALAMPHELSGGMRQRVAIARALANNPDVLLMDEPFGAIDAFTRITLQKRLLEVWEQSRKTIVFVTHSVDESVYLADEIIVMGTNPGRIVDRFSVDLPRPRRRDDPAYAGLVAHILTLLEQQDDAATAPV
ncbi:MAG: ABC transporter ATP-binding protein [Desulfovibrio sp.]|nr:ABC transporter ATP-binding protein [Desulfovibrio sp.]